MPLSELFLNEDTEIYERLVRLGLCLPIAQGGFKFAGCLERCESKGKSQFWVFALPNFQQLTFKFVASCEMGRGGFNAIPWLLKIGITMLINNKDDIEFVTEFTCFLGHPVYKSIFVCIK